MVKQCCRDDLDNAGCTKCSYAKGSGCKQINKGLSPLPSFQVYSLFFVSWMDLLRPIKRYKLSLKENQEKKYINP